MSTRQGLSITPVGGSSSRTRKPLFLASSFPDLFPSNVQLFLVCHSFVGWQTRELCVSYVPFSPPSRALLHCLTCIRALSQVRPVVIACSPVSGSRPGCLIPNYFSRPFVETVFLQLTSLSAGNELALETRIAPISRDGAIPVHSHRRLGLIFDCQP